MGSVWHKWDFHLHTPCSILNNNFGDPGDEDTWEKYISELVKVSSDNEIVAVGITDYFTIEGYKKLLEYKERGRLDKLFIFPNIEFRLNQLVKGRRINLHVLFSPEVLPQKIEENFLHDLCFVRENHPFDGTELRKLKISNLREFGENLQKQHGEFSDRSPLYIGCMNAVVDYEQINNTLRNNFKGDYFVVLAEEDLSVMGWSSQYHAMRKQLIQMSHAIFASNQESREFYLGKKHPSPEEYINEFKSFKPCIWGCDSHSFDERFLEPDLNRYCWIKSEVTWDGLKQILYEPEYRVAIQENNPEPNKNIYSLSRVGIPQTEINETLSIDDIEININPNLVAVIGGRGSGKTALLDLIASCFLEGKKLYELEQSFFYRVFVESDIRYTSSQSIDVQLEFISGDMFRKEVAFENDNVFFEKSDIIYLTQDHFEEFSSNPNKLNKHLIELIFEKFPDEKRNYDGDQYGIQEVIREIQNINLLIQQLEEEIEGERQGTEVEMKKKQGEKADYEDRIVKIEKLQKTKPDDLRELTKLQDFIKSKIRQVEKIIPNIQELLERITSFRGYYQEKTQYINKELIDILSAESGLQNSTILSELNLVYELLTNTIDRLKCESSKQQEALLSVNKKIDELEGVSKEIADLHLKLNEINLQIQETQEKLDYIEKIEERILTLDAKRYKTYRDLIVMEINLKLFLQQMIDKFETGKNEMLNNLSFSAKVEPHKNRLYIKFLAEKVDNRSHSEESLIEKLDPILHSLSKVLNGDSNNPDLEETLSQLSEFAKSLNLKSTTTSSDFYNALLTPFFDIGLVIKFNGKILRDLSMGERAIVLLKVLLALDDTPLFIDQPEEHLDNKYIYDELMPAFRCAKNNRQIIIATHNANLVVNTDAEQIVIANSENGHLSYHIGTLENPETREMIKILLEGGDDAFKKREQKYGYLF